MYFSIENRTDQEVGDVFPQVDCLNQTLAHSIRSTKLMDLQTDLLYDLKKKAKLTNILSQTEISATGLLVDGKTKSIFDKFKLDNHKYYPAKIKIAGGVVKDSYFLQFGTKLQDADWLDYERSTFFVTKFATRLDQIQIISYQDFLERNAGIDDMCVIRIDKTSINKKQQINADLFVLPRLTKAIFISERLKLALEENSITGITFQQVFE